MMRSSFASEHDAFRTEFGQFVRDAIVPHNADWAARGAVDRDLFTAAGRAGYLGRSLPAAFGGHDERDFRFSQIMCEEWELAGVAGAGSGLGLHNDMVVPYFANYASAEQRGRWFAGLCSGALIGAIAITEPDAGSDIAGIRTTLRRQARHFVLNGRKTLIGN